MSKLQYTFKTDTLFKMLFVQYPELLKKLVAALLGIPLDGAFLCWMISCTLSKSALLMMASCAPS